MPDEKRRELSTLRLANAKQCLITAKVNISIGDYKAAANRSYYAVFNAIRAVLALDRFDSKKHSGIIAEFRRSYIKSGKISENLSKVISRLFEVRNESDYNDFYLISIEEVQEQVAAAEEFVATIEAYLKQGNQV